MPGSRLLLPSLLAAVLLAQQPQTQPPVEQPGTVISTTVQVVQASVLVTDRDGEYVTGLQPSDFRLFDNDKEQDIRVDVSFQPISMVIAVQANDHVESVLPKIQKIGNLVQPLMIGEQGEAAVVCFDHRIQVLQDFTSDSAKVEAAVKKIHAGSSTSAMIDAVNRAVYMLRSRPQNRRRIILLISETRDYGSEGRARETLINAQLNNVSVYPVDISRVYTTLMAKQRVPRPNPLPPAAAPLPAGVPRTPTSVAQTYGTEGGRAEFIPLMIELLRDVKAVFKDNPVELFTKGTGGTEYGFTRQAGLEDALRRIGTELHSQYMVAYSPNNKMEGGWHQIKVEILNRRDLKASTRPGYWLAARQ
jgi:VWFA-related protein